MIGYTEFRTNLPGGRHANEATMRATVVRLDGGERRTLAASLAAKPDSWTQFSGWSPDGKTAIIAGGFNDRDNAAWEERHRDFRFTTGQRSLDLHLVDIETEKPFNVTAVDRVSDYNYGLFFWPGDANKLGFTALIHGRGHPFSMSRNGKNKRDLTADSKEFSYGLETSPDGKRIAYHKNYRIHVANADGSQAQLIETGNAFNFVPRWSPDGRRLLFVSGEHYNCHPYVVNSDGSGLRKLADRNGYRGSIAFLDVADFHGGSSDVPCWSADGKSVFYTAKVGDSVELFQVAVEGGARRLTSSPPGTLNYHPTPSPDGRFLLIGSKRDSIRQLFVMDIASLKLRPLTNLKSGHGAMWPHWQPKATA